MWMRLSPFVAVFALAGCLSAPEGGGIATRTALAAAPAVDVPTDGYETYVTQHNGFTRVRRIASEEPNDDLILARFEDANPASPSGFRSIADFRRAGVTGRVNVEVIAQQDSATAPIGRLLRLTTDVQGAQLASIAQAGGRVTLAGTDFSLVRAGAGSTQYDYAQQSDNGALYLALDFDTQTATIHVLNEFTRQNGWNIPERIDLIGRDLPFDVESGLFGGDIAGEVTYVAPHLGVPVVDVTGTVLGSVGGSRADDLVAGGVFWAEGTNPTISTLRVDGVFVASN